MCLSVKVNFPYVENHTSEVQYRTSEEKDWPSSDDWMIRGDGSSGEYVRVKANYSSDDANPDYSQSSDDSQPLY